MKKIIYTWVSFIGLVLVKDMQIPRPKKKKKKKEQSSFYSPNCCAMF